jgi:hypothetical protein
LHVTGSLDTSHPAEAVLGSDAERDDKSDESDDSEDLDEDDDGYAILPPRGDRGLDPAKNLIRKYITANYRTFIPHLIH